jgi:CDP-diacylglycerol--glycerol-3-phosphate 3-phosphatidyltransferase
MIDYLKRTFDRLPITQEKKRVLNLPNAITLLRIGIIPVLFFLLESPGPDGSLLIAGIFVMASLTDLLDGYVARRYQIVTTMGKFLDPIADKLVVNTAMILTIASSEGVIIGSSRLAKQKTLCQVVAVTALMIHYPFLGADSHLVGIAILYVALLLTLYSGLDYLVKFFNEIFNKKN